MSEKNHTAALTTVLLRQIHVLANGKVALVFARGLTQHDFGVLLLALSEHAGHERHFVFADHKLELVLHELDHTLDNETFERLTVLGSLTRVAVSDFLHGENFELFDALSTHFHLIKTEGVALARSLLPVLSVHLIDVLLVLLLSLAQLLLEQALRIRLTLSLTLEHDLEGALMGVLSHHALQLERVLVQLHIVLAL